MIGHTICALGEAAALPVDALVRQYRGELESRMAPPQAEERIRRSAAH